MKLLRTTVAVYVGLYTLWASSLIAGAEALAWDLAEDGVPSWRF